VYKIWQCSPVSMATAQKKEVSEGLATSCVLLEVRRWRPDMQMRIGGEKQQW